MSDLDFANWTLGQVRTDGFAMAWFEERRFDWCQVAHRFVNDVINGSAIILCTDAHRQWFGRYIIQAINLNKGRPLIPIFSLEAMFSRHIDINDDLIEDMLEVAFGDKNKYVIWYIGHSNDKLVNLAIKHPHSFMWVFDGNLHTAFNLDLKDANVDIKLLQLFKILDKTINAIMFDEISGA